MKLTKTARKKRRARPAGSPRLGRNRKHSVTGLRRWLRVHVRAPQVSVTAPVPTVQVDAPSVNIEAPKPIVIPAPVVKIDVEEESADYASYKGLRRELRKCLKQNQPVELLLASDFGSDNRKFQTGSLTRVDEGIVELRATAPDGTREFSILIPLNRIVAIIPGQSYAAQAAPAAEDEGAETEPISLRLSDEDRESLASG